MGYIPYVLGVAPFWVFGLIAYIHTGAGVKMFSQEWLDAAAMVCVYVLMICVPAILVIRLLMHFSRPSYHHH